MPEDSGRDIQNGSRRFIQRGRIWSQLDVREFPKLGVDSSHRPLPHQKASATFCDDGDESAGGGGRSPASIGEAFNLAGALCHTLGNDRAERALWLGRCADKGTQLHQGLIERGALPISRGARLRGETDQSLGERPKSRIGRCAARIAFDAEEAGQHPYHIAVQDGGGLIEGDAADGSSGVAPNAWQGQNLAETFRKFTVMLLDEDLGGFLQVASSSVVAQSFPKFQHLVGLRFCERLDGREAAHPALPIGQDRFHLGLLEHDFRNPNCIRFTSAPPRKIASILAKPPQQCRHPEGGRNGGPRPGFYRSHVAEDKPTA